MNDIAYLKVDNPIKGFKKMINGFIKPVVLQEGNIIYF